MSSSEIRREDLFIYALYFLEGHEKYIVIEDVYKKAHELLPSAFSWTNYPEIPSDRKANMALQHIREQKGKSFILNNKNHSKLKLSSEAVEYIQNIKDNIESSLEINPIKFSTRSSNAEELKIIQILHNEEYVSKVINEEMKLIEDQILHLLKISSLSPVSIKLKKIDQLTNLAKKNNSNSTVIKFLERCREFYG